MLQWTFDFIKKEIVDGEEEPRVLFTRTYKDGKPVTIERDEHLLMFLSYISLFPGKELVKLKLGLENQSIYSVYYLDKSYFDEGYLGAFNIQEFGTNTIFEWEDEKQLLNLFVENYYQIFLENDLAPDSEKQKEKFEQFVQLLDEGMAGNFENWQTAREEVFDAQAKEKRAQLADTFQVLGAVGEEKLKKERKEKIEKSRKKPKKGGKLKLKEVSSEEITQGARSIIVLNQDQQPLEEKRLETQKYNLEEIATVKKEEDYNWDKVDRLWDFQLINEFGIPLTGVMSFENGEQKEWGSQEQQNVQSLESMTISVLKSIITFQNLNLREMKVELPDGEGYQTLLFHNFRQKNAAYIILMTVANFDRDEQKYIDLMFGDERKTARKIATALKEHPEWFGKDGCLADADKCEEIESLFYRECKIAFHKISRRLF